MALPIAGRRYFAGVAAIVRTWRTEHPLDLLATLSPTIHGRRDPTTRWDGSSWWRASRTPDGPVTLRVSAPGGDRVVARAWGPGAAWALEHAPALLAEETEIDDLARRPGVVGGLRRARPGLRMCRTANVIETMVPFILEQKVTTIEAKRGWSRMASAWGEPAPGPAGKVGLMLPPSVERMAAEPYWRFHRFGIERKRADIIRMSCRLRGRLEEVASMSFSDADHRMQAVPGIGPWTAGLVAQVALGEPDSVVVGDYHFPHIVSYTLTGERRGSDERMLELLEPFRPFRGLAQRLIILDGRRPERRAPKAQLRDLRAI